MGSSGEDFIKFREVHLADSSLAKMEIRILGREVNSITDSIYQRYCIENWDIPRLRTYIDMLKAFGFNSIQIGDHWQSYYCAGWDGEPRDWPEKVDAIADYARKVGLRTTLFLWGNTAVGYSGKKFHYRLCPNDPAEREILERNWEHQVLHAPHFDHIVTHWVDPGGCDKGGCTIETAQHLHNEILKRFRKKNPKIQSTFSLWMLHTERFGKWWSGYKDVHTILDSGILPPEVMLAQDGNGGRFDLEEAREIVKAGRKIGNWGWYLVNMEILPSFYVRTSLLANYFSTLPPEAHKLIEWHSIDSNNHGINMHNLYVAGKLMRAPQADAQAVLREFIAGAMGAQNVEKVEKVLRFIENARKVWRYHDDPEASVDEARDVHARGSADEAREAQSIAQDISIPEGFTPAFPMIITPEDLAQELVAQIEAIAEFLEFSEAASRVEKMKEEGALQDKIESAIANLPKVKRPSEWMTNFDYCFYLAKLEELKKH